MYELKITDEFSAAHQLNFFKTGCERLHGHNWKVEVYVQGKKLNPDGILIDFKELKKILKEVLSPLDHRFLNELEPFNTISPSSENLASFLFKEIQKRLPTKDVKVSKVTVWESDNSCASYLGELDG